MSDKIKIANIELETGRGAKVRLTLQEAKELHSQLDELFGTKVTYVPSAPIYIDRYDYFRPYQPYWTTDSCKVITNSGLAVSYNAS